MISPIESRIRLASILVMAGLLVALGSFLWHSPLALFLFAIGAGGLVGMGILVFLVSLFTVGETGGHRGVGKHS